MNKVFSCADDCDVNIYYQDTDSIHLNYGDVYTVVKRYTQQIWVRVSRGRSRTLPYLLLNG